MTTLQKLVELIALTSSSLSEDVEKKLKKSLAAEKKAGNASAVLALSTILKNVAIARRDKTPLCQDTGTLTFFVDGSLRRIVTESLLKKAVAIATEKGYLRKNTIDSITGLSYDSNCAEGAPEVHYIENADKTHRKVTLLMKGGGSENMSRQYSLPDSSLGAGRDLEGVRKCLLDAVHKIQGYGCAPGILGVCIGGDRAASFKEAKMQLLRPLSDSGASENVTLRKLEKTILKEANTLGIGPMGLGGKTTLLGVNITSRSRVPASFFVTVAYLCWAARRRTIEI
jgi:fumarate hydratase class I